MSATVLVTSLFKIDETIDLSDLVHIYMGALTSLCVETPLSSRCVCAALTSAGDLLPSMPLCVRWVCVCCICANYSNDTQLHHRAPPGAVSLLLLLLKSSSPRLALLLCRPLIGCRVRTGYIVTCQFGI